MNDKFPKNGEVWFVNFDPAVGTEIKKTRPAVVVSNNNANKFLERVQVLPITSNTQKVYPCECVIHIKDKTGKVMADQIMTVSKRRLYKKICALESSDMAEVKRIIKIQLDLEN